MSNINENGDEIGTFEEAKAAAQTLLPGVDFNDPFVEEQFRVLCDKFYRVEDQP